MPLQRELGDFLQAAQGCSAWIPTCARMTGWVRLMVDLIAGILTWARARRIYCW